MKHLGPSGLKGLDRQIDPKKKKPLSLGWVPFVKIGYSSPISILSYF